MMLRSSSFFLLLFVMFAGGQFVDCQSTANELTIVVTDENGVAVPGARVELQGPGRPVRCETDLAGRCRFTRLTGAPWQLRVEKEGFYLFALPAVQTSGTLEVTITHQQEIRETVNV